MHSKPTSPSFEESNHVQWSLYKAAGSSQIYPTMYNCKAVQSHIFPISAGKFHPKLSPWFQFVAGSAASAHYWMLMTCCCGCALSAPAGSKFCSCAPCIVTLSPFQLENACTIFRCDLLKDFSDKPAAGCVVEAARQPLPL